MRRAHALALAVAVVLAGCPAATTDEGTVTPAPVPSPPSPAATPATTPCDVPTPAPTTPTDAEAAPAANGTATETPSSDPSSVPVEDGTVNATALLERHDRTLRAHSYELRAPGRLVQIAPGQSALRVRVRSSISAVRHYAVDGTRYSYTFRYGGRARYGVEPYDADAFRRGFGSSSSLTGSDWLSEALSVGFHRVVDRRADGRTVLRADGVATEADRTATRSDDRRTPTVTGGPTETRRDRTPSTDDTGSIRSLNSTVVVDARGVVRSVEQQYVVEEDGTARRNNRSFAVTDVGTATVERPRWVCIAERSGLVEVP